MQRNPRIGRKHARHNTRGLGLHRFNLGATIPRRYFPRLDAIADRLGISRSQVVEAALSLFIMMDEHHAART